ncbi:MAG: 50S ribosomal protein L24 [Bacilli bacterium]
MNLKEGDKVIVIAGKDKGKQGKIVKTLRQDKRIIVEGVNYVKKHVKGDGQKPGSITEMEAPMHVSNVMIMDPKAKKKSRIGHSTDKLGKKIRIAKKSNESID